MRPEPLDRPLVLWDFDGTLYRGDAFIDLLVSTMGKVKFACVMLQWSPSWVQWKLGAIDAGTAKQRLFFRCYAGHEEHAFTMLLTEFTQRKMFARLRPEALRRVNWHREQGHLQCIVSANLGPLVRLAAEQLGMDHIGTELEMKEGRLTGRFAGPNCQGPEKKKRLERHWVLPDRSQVWAYGDSVGDTEMLALAGNSFYKRFE